MVTIGYIFCEFGQRSVAQELPSLLRSAMSRLRLENLIHVLPGACPKCSLVCSEKTYAKWPSCKTSNFTFASLPHLRFPYLSLEEQLRSLLMVQGMEDLLHRRTTISRAEGTHRDIDYAVVQGSRYLASRRTHPLSDTAVLVRTSGAGTASVVSYQDHRIPHQLFAHVK